MDRVNRAIQGADDLEQMMSDVLEVVLDVFDCDRVFLLHPCDPGDTHWTVPMERTRPEYPGVLALGQPIPMDNDVANTLQALLDHPGPRIFGPGMDHPLPRSAAERFSIKSFISMAVRPKTDKPWQLGLHQCSREREWNPDEVRLFEEVGRRLSDALDTLLTTRNLRESEERFRLVFENSPLPIWEEDFSMVKPRLDELKAAHGTHLEDYLIEHPEIVRQCAELVCIVDVNQAAVDLHEAGSKEALFKGLANTFTDDSYVAFRQELAALAMGKSEMLIDSTVQTLAARQREVTVYFSVCPGYEHSLGKVLVSVIDITERKQSEDRLRLAASVFASSQEGILISDAENHIIDVNPGFALLTGYSREEALGKNPSFLSAGRQSPDFYAEMWRSINTTGTWQGEIWNRRKSGDAYAELLSIVAVQDGQGRLQHYVGAFTDISMLKEHEADLDRIAHYDVLTAVPNRRLLGDRLEQAIARAHRLGKSLAVCYLDLDGFKPINDQFGHEGGDRLLVEIARRLQAISRADDTVARLGGDEFVMLWNDIGDESECSRALERILAEVSAPMMLDAVPVSVSASIGVTLYPDDNVDADSLLRHADHAMYSAKQLGKNRYQMFDSRLERQISSRVEFLAKVAHGLESGQFELHYQPKVDCVAGRLIGVEALMRWNDPILGLVGPKEFLPLIENDNLAFQMGRWVMEQAVRQTRIWHEAGLDVPVSINVFPRHLKFPTFIEDLRNAIARDWPEMPANRLMMEIVETSDLEELDPIEAVIKECLGMGIGFSLDDFGTGYSSLVYLRRLSVEELKIDQSFVRDMMADPDDQAIVAGVIGLGKAFNLRVVAEGVESPEQAQHLVAMGCSVVQGYGFGRPMPANAIPEWLCRYLSQGVKI
jgi:diguanylate cyclase (GGDEF)-like protein/PAS domain S-box-containing protein